LSKRLLFKLGLVIASVAAVSAILVGCGGKSAANTATSSTLYLSVLSDIVSSVGCVNTSAVHQGENLAFRVKVIDPLTNEPMDDTLLQSVTAKLPDGQTFNLTYGGHPSSAPTDNFWSAPWEVPLTYPTGTLGYEVDVVAKDGRTGTYQQFNVAASSLNVVAYNPAFVAGKTISISATGASPAALVCSQGAKVTFSNKDTVAHDIAGDGWDSGSIAPGKTFARVFSDAGTFNYHDTTNPAISGSITVNPAPTATK